MSSTKEHVIEFLRAYFEGDGSGSTSQISASTSSESLALDLQQLLLALEIRSSRKVHPPTKNGNHNRNTITISGNDACKFMDLVGFISKSTKLDSTVGRNKRSFPHVRKALRGCVQPSGYYVVGNKKKRMTLWDHKIFSAYYEGGTTDSITEYTLARYIGSKCGEDLKMVQPALHKRITRLLEGRTEWTRVESIGNRKTVPTFDTMVPKTHNFVANGFVVHNTYNLEVALARRNSSVVRHSNGALPRVRNPAMIPHLCKHLVLISNAGVKEARDLAAEKMAEEMGQAEEAEKVAAAHALKPKKVLPRDKFVRPGNRNKFVDLT